MPGRSQGRDPGAGGPIWRVVVASYSSADRLADVWIRHTIPPAPCQAAGLYQIVRPAGEKGVLSPFRAAHMHLECGGAGGIFHLHGGIGRGIRTPKWRINRKTPGNSEGQRPTCGLRSWHRSPVWRQESGLRTSSTSKRRVPCGKDCRGTHSWRWQRPHGPHVSHAACTPCRAHRDRNGMLAQITVQVL